MAKEYWYCIIGPVYDEDKFSSGSDAPLRASVKVAFRLLIGRDADMCWSGWGLSEADRKRMLSAKYSSENMRGGD